ncbi:MAG: XRE family transcriptional regulator [Pseudomonadota bacterium]
MSDLTQAELSDTNPGIALKNIRLKLGLTLADVSERSSIPLSTLSKIENGKSLMTMDRMSRIAVALDVNIVDILCLEKNDKTTHAPGRRSVTRLGEENVLFSPHGEYAYHAQDLLEKSFIPIVAKIKTKSVSEFGDYHRHDGDEFVLVLQGELALYSDTYAPLNLKKGESVYFDSRIGHAYVSVGSEPCELLIICCNDGKPITKVTKLSQNS